MEQKLLSTVTSVSAQVDPANPSVLLINATGEAPSVSYSNILLEPLDYAAEPTNGVYEFLLTGIPTDADPAKELTPVTANTFHWIDFPENLRGVIIIAYENSLATSIREEYLTPTEADKIGEENY
jgi:hypothetical protein